MTKRLGLSVFISMVGLHSAYAASMDDFKKNIITPIKTKGTISSKKLNYNSLDENEKNAIDAALNIFAPHFAFCGDRTFYQYESWNPLYEIQDFKGRILYWRYPLERTDILNGVAWKGVISISIGEGVARALHKNGSYSQWVEVRDIPYRSINLPAITTSAGIKSNPKSSEFIDGMWSVPSNKNFKELECN